MKRGFHWRQESFNEYGEDKWRDMRLPLRAECYAACPTNCHGSSYDCASPLDSMLNVITLNRLEPVQSLSKPRTLLWYNVCGKQRLAFHVFCSTYFHAMALPVSPGIRRLSTWPLVENLALTWIGFGSTC